MPNNVAVIGASGQTGPEIVRGILRHGGTCRVVGRDVEKLRLLFGTDARIEARAWDPEKPESIAQALSGIDTAIYLVAVPYNHFELHPAYMQRTIDAAVRCGVQRLLLLAPVYSYGVPQPPLVSESHPREPHTRKGRFRKAQEDLVLGAHASGTIQGAVLRLPDFFGPRCTLSIVHDVFLAAKKGRRANLLGPINTPHQFCYVPDLGEIVARLALEPKAYGRGWNFAGSGTISQEILGREAFRQAGTKPGFLQLGKNGLNVIGLFNPIMRELVEMSYLHTNPVLLDDRDVRALLGDVSVTPYDAAVQETLAAL